VVGFLVCTTTCLYFFFCSNRFFIISVLSYGTLKIMYFTSFIVVTIVVYSAVYTIYLHITYTFVWIRYAVRDAPVSLPREPSHRRCQSQPVIEASDPDSKFRDHHRNQKIQHRVRSLCIINTILNIIANFITFCKIIYCAHTYLPAISITIEY